MKEALKNKITALKQKAEQEEKESRAAIIDLEEQKTQLLKGLEENLKENNTTAYIENSKRLSEVSMMLDYHNKVLFNTINAPLISKEEYTVSLQEIIEELDKMTEEANEKINDLAKKARQIRDEANSKINEANEQIRMLQLDCYKDPSVIGANGRLIEPRVTRYRNYISLHPFKD